MHRYVSVRHTFHRHHIDHNSMASLTHRYVLWCCQSWQRRGPRKGGAYDNDDYDNDDVDLSSIVILGTSQTLEKSYFRLTAAPVRGGGWVQGVQFPELGVL